MFLKLTVKVLPKLLRLIGAYSIHAMAGVGKSTVAIKSCHFTAIANKGATFIAPASLVHIVPSPSAF